MRIEKECVCSVSVVRFKFHCYILISDKIIKEMPGSVASGTPYTFSTPHYWALNVNFTLREAFRECGLEFPYR